METMQAWSADLLAAAIEFRGLEPMGHIRQIREVTRILLEKAIADGHATFSPDEVDKICSAAALHDIGKILIPEDILCKPGRLSVEEYRIMRTHPLKGWELLEKLCVQIPDHTYYSYCCTICRSHHERWDGNGYPDGLKGEQTPFWVQVVALADVYDSLLHRRVYKPAYPHEKAAQMIMRGDCGDFNPILLECFTEVGPRLKEMLASPQE